MTRKKKLLALSLFLALLGLSVILLSGLIGGEEERIDGQDIKSPVSSETSLESESERRYGNSRKVPSDNNGPTGADSEVKEPGQGIPQFIRIQAEGGADLADAKLFLIPDDRAEDLSPPHFSPRRYRPRLQSAGLGAFKGYAFRSPRSMEISRKADGRFPLPEKVFTGFTAFAMANGFCADVFTPRRKASGETIVVLKKKGTLVVGDAGGFADRDLFIEAEDVESKYARSRFFLFRLKSGKDGRFVLDPGRYRFRAWTYEYGITENGDKRKTPEGFLMSETGEIVHVESGSERELDFDFQPKYLINVRARVTVRLMYEGKNVTPREIFETLNREVDDVLAQDCQPKVQFFDFKDDSIVTKAFFRFDSDRALAFDLVKDKLCRFHFYAYYMNLGILRWGIFPNGQTIDLNLSRHDFPKGKGAINVSVKSTAPDGAIETRLLRLIDNGFLHAGSARGKSMVFRDLEPGTYEVSTELGYEYLRSQSQSEDVIFKCRSKKVDVRGKTVNVTMDMNDLHAMDLTILDESELPDDESSYILLFNDCGPRDFLWGKGLYIGSKQVRIEGLRKGRYLVSVGKEIEEDGMLILSRPVAVDLGLGTPSVFVKLKNGGKKVTHLVKRPFKPGKEVTPEARYEVRLYDEEDRPWVSFCDGDFYEFLLPEGRFRIEFRELGKNSPGPSVMIDATHDKGMCWALWDRKQGKVTVYDEKQYRRYLNGE